jgi:hypothetical protein
VRRPLRPFSLTVQAYLVHLPDAGFTGAPLPFGVDEQGREVLSFVPGEVPHRTPESLGGAEAASLPLTDLCVFALHTRLPARSALPRVAASVVTPAGNHLPVFGASGTTE